MLPFLLARSRRRHAPCAHQHRGPARTVRASALAVNPQLPTLPSLTRSNNVSGKINFGARPFSCDRQANFVTYRPFEVEVLDLECPRGRRPRVRGGSTPRCALGQRVRVASRCPARTVDSASSSTRGQFGQAASAHRSGCRGLRGFGIARLGWRRRAPVGCGAVRSFLSLL